MNILCTLLMCRWLLAYKLPHRTPIHAIRRHCILNCQDTVLFCRVAVDCGFVEATLYDTANAPGYPLFLQNVHERGETKAEFDQRMPASRNLSMSNLRYQVTINTATRDIQGIVLEVHLF